MEKKQEPNKRREITRDERESAARLCFSLFLRGLGRIGMSFAFDKENDTMIFFNTKEFIENKTVVGFSVDASDAEGNWIDKSKMN